MYDLCLHLHFEGDTLLYDLIIIATINLQNKTYITTLRHDWWHQVRSQTAETCWGDKPQGKGGPSHLRGKVNYTIYTIPPYIFCLSWFPSRSREAAQTPPVESGARVCGDAAAKTITARESRNGFHRHVANISEKSQLFSLRRSVPPCARECVTIITFPQQRLHADTRAGETWYVRRQRLDCGCIMKPLSTDYCRLQAIEMNRNM